MFKEVEDHVDDAERVKERESLDEQRIQLRRAVFAVTGHDRRGP